MGLKDAIIAIGEAVGLITRKQIRESVQHISRDEAIILVRNYYQQQENRKRGANQNFALESRGVSNTENVLVSFLGEQAAASEALLKKALDDFTMQHPVGRWCREIRGIGPVIAAGLIAHIKIEVCPTAGHIWSFAGLNPDIKWEKGQKRPFNAELKKLCWHIGQGFMKTSNKEDGYYGQLYREKKEYYIARNDAGEFRERALKDAEKYSKTTDAYKYTKEGKLPPAHIDAMARRYAVKIFLSHLHERWYEFHFGEKAPKPFAIAHLDHVHVVRNLLPPITE